MRKTTKLLLAALLAGSVLLASCASGGGETSAVPDVSGTESTPFVPPAETPATWSEFDLNTSWLETDPHIELTEGNTRTEWPGAKLVGGDLYIKQPGTYVLSGTLKGQLFISVDKTTKVHLVFKGFTVHEDALSPILCERADKVVITLADGTENYVNDMHSGFVDGGTPPDGRNAGAIHAKMGLTINGNGSLTVNSTYRHGIVSNSNLRIVSGDITVNAVEEGLKGKESVSIRGGNILIASCDDGIKVNQADEEDQGFFAMEGGTVKINTEADGIDVIKYVRIVGGSLQVQSFDHAIVTEGSVSIAGAPTIRLHADSGKEDSDAKGIKAEGDVTVENGTLLITKAFEGIESKNASVRIAGGRVVVHATNDGVNGGSLISVEGGSLHVVSGGDGLDSGGNIRFAGGSTVICGSPSNAYAPMDVPEGSEILTDGGFVLAYGSLNAVQFPSQNSAQPFLAATVSMKQGTVYALRDRDGNNVVTFTARENALTLCVSSSELTAGEYTLYRDVTPEGNDFDGIYSSSTGGEAVETFSIS